jgi:hypothetical protein
MCQEAVRKLCNPSESCHVRKVARLLARPLSRRRSGPQPRCQALSASGASVRRSSAARDASAPTCLPSCLSFHLYPHGVCTTLLTLPGLSRGWLSLRRYSPECVENRNSRKFAVTNERQFGLQGWRSLRTLSLPARIEGKFVGFAARDCYEQWRLATLQLPEKFSKERDLP